MAKLSDLKTLLRSAGSKPTPAARAAASPAKRAGARTVQTNADIDLEPGIRRCRSAAVAQPRAHRQGASRADAGQAPGR